MKALNWFLFGFTAEGEEARQPEGHAFYLLKSEKVSVLALQAKLPGGRDINLSDPWGQGVASMHPGGRVLGCWLNYSLLYNWDRVSW